MKILVVGDPHGFNKFKKALLKKVDLILLTGDIGKADLARKMFFNNIKRKKKGLPEIEYTSKQKKKSFMQAYNSTIDLVKRLKKFTPVYTIFGNVESSNEDTRRFSKTVGLKLPLLVNNLGKMKGVRIINNRVANFHGVRIGGIGYFTDTSWVRTFKPSDYKEKLSDAKKETDKAKRVLKNFGYVDILLCHQPPYGVLDRVNFPGAPKHWQNKHAGSKVLLDYVKKKKPKYVFCGHIHEAKGKKKVGKTEVNNVGCSGDYVLVDIE